MIEISFTSLAESFAWCILQVTLFAAAALVIYGFVRRQRPDHNVLMLAASLATVGLMTLTFLSPWPRWALDSASPTSSARLPKPIAHLQSSPPNNTSTPDGTPGASSNGRALQEFAPPHSLPPLPNPGPNTPPTESLLVAIKPQWWRWAIGTAWLLAAIGFARFLIGLAYVHRYRRQSVPIDDDQIRDEFNAIARELHLAILVTLVEVPSLTVAATIGWHRPLVILPASWRDWTADERRAVLAHELAHVAQRHFPLWLIGQLAVATHFYHPLVHWLGRRLRLEQELAADQLAVQIFGNRQNYAEILAGLALAPERSTYAHTSLGLFMSRPLLMRRIAMLRQQHQPRRASRFAVPAGFALLLVVACGAFGLRATSNAVADDLSVPEAQLSATHAGQCEVTALLKVSCDQPRMLSNANRDSDWHIICNTQLAYLRSYFVLQAALRVPGIQDLPLIRKNQSDQVAWLNSQFEVGFYPDSEIMYVQMRGKLADVAQLRAIVDAVCEAYLKEVVFEEEQRRLVVRDALQRSYTSLSNEIRNKLDTQSALASDLGAADRDGKSRVMQDLELKRLERIEIELLRLEDEQLSAQIYSDQQKGEIPPKDRARLSFYERRIAELRKRQDDLEERIAKRNQSSVELTIGANELEQLQEIAREMSVKLERMDVEAVAPDHIRRIQKAM